MKPSPSPSLVLAALCLLLALAPGTASAQNLWPMSFAYWTGHPDPFLADLHQADRSMDAARSLDPSCDRAFRAMVDARNRAMSQRELSLYNSPNVLAPIYPDGVGSAADHVPPGATGTPSARTTSPFSPGGSSLERLLPSPSAGSSPPATRRSQPPSPTQSPSSGPSPSPPPAGTRPS